MIYRTPTTLVNNCYAVKCKDCGKTTWQVSNQSQYLFRLSGGGSVGWIILIIDAHMRTDDWVDGIKNDGYV